MTELIEEENGRYWIACNEANQFQTKVVTIGDKTCHVYHPNAKIIGESWDGSDDQYKCPHCNKTWWVEYD